MKTPHPAKPNTNAMNRTISLTDGEWDAIGRWAGERGKSRAQWMRECALTVDLPTKKAVARPLVLDAGEQRYISRTVRELAGRLSSSGNEAAENPGDDLRALLAARLRTMAGDGRREAAVELLRTVFGEQRAEIIAAAFIPESPSAHRTNDGPPETRPDDHFGQKTTPQRNLFDD